MVDAIIVGRGPAGCATAIALRRQGATVAIVDRAAHAPAHAGETLAPAACDTLARLGVADRFRADGHEPSCGVRAAWGSARLHSNDFLLHPNAVGWHLDRARFDRMMAGAALDTGATILPGARLVGLSSTGDGWEVTLQEGERRSCVSGRVLVDATGRAACVARRLGAHPIAFDRLIAIARLFALRDRDHAAHSYALLEAANAGWWYSAVLPGNRAVSVFFTDPEFRRDIQPAPHTRERFARCIPLSDYTVRPAHSAVLDRPAGRRWLAVGDAASTWDPLSSQGIDKAMRSGIGAAAAIAEHLCGDASAFARYASGVHAAFGQYLDVYRKFYRREARWPRAPFWRRRHSSVNEGLLKGEHSWQR